MLPLGGLHVKYAVQRGTWVPSQHLLWHQGNRVGRSQDLPDANWLLASSLALNTRALTLVPISAAALLKNIYKLFLQIFLCAYNLDKHQTVYNICGRNERIYEQTCIQIYIYIYVWLFDYHFRNQSQSHVTTDGQSVSTSWCQIHSGTCDQILFSVWKLLCCLCGAPSLTRGRICLLSVTVISV
jgi:hypothetical protein